MANLKRRTGGKSSVVIGRQGAYGTPIKVFTGPGVEDDGSDESITLSGTIDLTTANDVGTIAAVAASMKSGTLTLTAAPNAVGKIAVAGKDIDGDAVTETLTWENATASRAQTTQKTYARKSDITLTSVDSDLSEAGTITTAVSFQPKKTRTGMTQRRFPFLRNTLDPTSETAESESITGLNAAVPPIIISRAGGGEWEFEVLPEDAIHLLLGWFNPSTLPVPTVIADKTLTPDSKIDVQAANAGTQKIVITNDANTLIADWPGQLHIAFPSTSVLDGTGKIVINGEQRRSRSNKFNSQTFETIAGVTAADLKDATKGALSKKFYRKINEITLSGFSTFAATSEDPTLKFQPDTKSAALTLHALSELFNGWSTQMDKAGEPFIGYDIVPDSFRLNVSAGSMRLTLTVLASFVQEGRVLTKPLEIAYKIPTYDKPPTGQADELANYENAATDANDPQMLYLSRFSYKNTDFYPSYGTALAIGNPGDTLADLKTRMDAGTADIIPLTDLEMVCSHNYTDADGFTGDPVGGEPVTDDNQTRTVNVNATIVHRTDARITPDNKTIFWQDRYFEGQYVPIIVHNYNWNSVGRQTRIASEFPNCKLTEVPNLPIEGQGQVNRRLAFQAFPTENATRPNEIKMIFHSQEGFKE